MIKDLAIFGLELIFLILASPEKSWQSIYSYICLTLAIVNSKIVLKELLGSVDLFKAQTLCIYETTEIVVICEDKIFILATF